MDIKLVFQICTICKIKNWMFLFIKMPMVAFRSQKGSKNKIQETVLGSIDCEIKLAKYIPVEILIYTPGKPNA